MTSSPVLTRRDLLGATGSILVAGPMLALAGCSGLDTPGQLIVTVTNEDEIAHTVQVVVTDEADEVVTELPQAEIEPSASQTFDAGAFSVGTYQVTVSGSGESSWKQSTRWDDIDGDCPSLLFAVTLTRDNGVPSVGAETQCGSA